MMLIALLASDSSDPAEAAAAVAKLKCNSANGKCRLTGKVTFAEALAALVSSEDLKERVDEIEVARTTPSAMFS